MKMELSDHLTLASLMSAAIVAMKFAEKFFDWAGKKLSKSEKGEKVVVVQLDPEVSRMIRETHDKAGHVSDVVSVLDTNGTPMVYSSRTTSENVQLVAAAMKEVSHSAERLASTLDKVEENTREAISNTEAILQVVSKK